MGKSFIDKANEELPWPNFSDNLLEIGDDWTTTAILKSGFDPSYAIAEGYKIAADMLVEKVLSGSREIDFIVYPIVFNYRHHIELLLKEIIDKGFYLIGSDKPEIENNHNLMVLWRDAENVITKVWPNGSKDDLKAVNKIINQLNSIDPKSYHFRYLKSKKGTINNPDLKKIDISKFSKVINNLSSFLNGTLSGITEANSNRESY